MAASVQKILMTLILKANHLPLKWHPPKRSFCAAPAMIMNWKKLVKYACRKAYGNLRITKLNGSLEVDGMNADMKIRKVGPALSLIKIDDKYADIRIPLRETKNYSIDFTGRYSSVYGNFEKKEVKEEKTAAEEKKSGSGIQSHHLHHHLQGFLLTSMPLLLPVKVAAPYGEMKAQAPPRFTAVVGDGKGLKIDMKCQNCTVDFK
jgi:hypothetical protein